MPKFERIRLPPRAPAGLTITREQVGGTTRVRAVGKINGGGEKVVLQATGGDIRVSTGRAGPTLVKPR